MKQTIFLETRRVYDGQQLASSPLPFLDHGSAAKTLIAPTQYRQLRRLLTIKLSLLKGIIHYLSVEGGGGWVRN